MYFWSTYFEFFGFTILSILIILSGVVQMTADEHPKPKTLKEQIAKLPPVFKKGGVVTAASASGICDGAAAVIVASEEAVAKHGLTPLARIVGYGVAGKLMKILFCA